MTGGGVGWRLSSLFRLFLGGALLVAMGCGAAGYDRDGDGIIDRVDIDPFKAEDRDGVEDDDGLPELPSPAVASPGVSAKGDAGPDAPAELFEEAGKVSAEAEPEVSEAAAADTIDLPENCFLAGELNPDPEYSGRFDEIGRLMTANRNSRLIIRSFVDTTRAFEINRSLAEFRTQAVRDYLASKHDVRVSRIIIEPVSAGGAGGAPRRGRWDLVACRLRMILLHKPD